MSTLLAREFKNHIITQRQTDRYIDATAMCKANGKKWNDYRRLKATEEFIQALSLSTGIPAQSLAETGSRSRVNTYVHPDLAINLAQWCNATFAVLVSQWVNELLTTGKVELPQAVIPPLPPPPPPVPLPTSVRTVFPTNNESDPLLFQLNAMIEMRRTQLSHEQRLTAVESLVVNTIQPTPPSRPSENWYTIEEWANLIGITLSPGEVTSRTVKMTYRANCIGLQLVSVKADNKWNRANAYPEYLLREVVGSGNLPPTAPPRLN